MVSNVYAENTQWREDTAGERQWCLMFMHPRPPRTVSTRVTAVAEAAGKHGSWKSQQYNTLSNKATKPTIQHLTLINFLVFRIGIQTLCFIFGPRPSVGGRYKVPHLGLKCRGAILW